MAWSYKNNVEEGNFVESTTAGGTPGGSDTQVQFNNAGSFGGGGQITWDDSLNILSIGQTSIGADGLVSAPTMSATEVTANTVNASTSVTIGAVKGLSKVSTTKLIVGDFDHCYALLPSQSGDMELNSLNAGAGIIFYSNGGVFYFDSGEAEFTLPVTLNDVLKLTPIADPASPTEGMVWAGTDHHLYYYNGTTKKQLDN